jgi:hypothetical protein
MAELALIASVVAAGASVAGGAIASEGAMQRGRAENDAAQAEAVQLDAKGREEFAASQQEAFAKRREGRLASSRAQALAAASGGGADDPTIVKLMSGIASESEYNAGTAMYGGVSRRSGLIDAANNRRRSGQASLLGSRYEAAGSFLRGVSGAASAFG